MQVFKYFCIYSIDKQIQRRYYYYPYFWFFSSRLVVKMMEMLNQ